MAHTLEELKEKMVDSLDEVTIMEILDIKAQDLVDRFEDKIDERFFGLSLDLFSDDFDREEDPEEKDSI